MKAFKHIFIGVALLAANHAANAQLAFLVNGGVSLLSHIGGAAVDAMKKSSIDPAKSATATNAEPVAKASSDAQTSQPQTETQAEKPSETPVAAMTVEQLKARALAMAAKGDLDMGKMAPAKLVEQGSGGVEGVGALARLLTPGASTRRQASSQGSGWMGVIQMLQTGGNN